MKKKLGYILIPIIISTWLGIFLKVKKLAPTHEPMHSRRSSISYSGADTLIPDSFSLTQNCHDPFLHTAFRKPKKNTRPKSTPPVVKHEKKPQPTFIIDRWKYFGTIQDDKNNKTVGIIQSENGNFLVETGDSITDILVKNIHNDSITLQKGKEIKSIKKWEK